MLNRDCRLSILRRSLINVQVTNGNSKTLTSEIVWEKFRRLGVELKVGHRGNGFLVKQVVIVDLCNFEV